MDDSKKRYLGKSRSEWVYACGRALLATMLPYAQFVLLQDGFQVFEQRAKPAFKELAGFPLSSSELRRVWDQIAAEVGRHPPAMRQMHERMFAEARTTRTASAAVAEDLLLTDRDMDIRVDVSPDKSTVH